MHTSSSSGGAFPAIAKAFYEDSRDNLVVFGAAFVDDFSVKHFGQKYREGITCFQESKYVRSDISESIKRIPELLRSGIPVMFAGTPCQVAVINSLIKKERCSTNLLLTVDLICHGTPKSELWMNYVQLIKEKYGKVKRICFRNNEHREKGRTFIELEDGRIVYDPIEMSTYMRFFSTCMSLYNGCFNCKFRNSELNRPADLTIGDFWGVQDVISDFKGVKDVSLVIPNTRKGQHIFELIEKRSTEKKALIRECKDERYKVFNPHLFEQTPIPNGYDLFWKDYKELPIEEFDKKYSEVSLKYKTKRWLSDTLGKMGLKYKIKGVIGHLKK